MDINSIVTVCLKNEENDGSIWQGTADILMDLAPTFKDESLSPKDKMRVFCDYLDSQVDPSLIPSEGENRGGSIISLRKKDGSVKWSSWRVTARLCQNVSDLNKGIEVLGWEGVFPDGKVISRTSLLSSIKSLTKDEEEKKVKETPYQTIIRCLDLVNQSIDKVDWDGPQKDAVNQRLIEITTVISDY